jgi:uncharacterized protein YjdB
MSIPVINITINEGDQTIIANHPFQFTANLQPIDTTSTAIVWNSSNTMIATVDNIGLVNGISEGVLTITVSSLDNPSINASVQVTVNSVPVDNITLNIETINLDVGSTFQLIPSITPSDATNKTVTWVSTNPAAASVDTNGLVTGIAKGLAMINAVTINNKIKHSNVYVQNIPVSDITISKSVLSLFLNDSIQLIATVYPPNATFKTVTWITSNSNILSVDQLGNVLATGIGTSTIVARAENKFVVSYIFVNPVNAEQSYTAIDSAFIPVSTITLNSSTITLNVGQSQQLLATITPAYASNQKLNWTSSIPSIVSIDQTGAITAISPGTAVINVASSDNKVTTQAFITVK